MAARRAPSFHDIMAPDDKILFVQTLSKNWAMTGWRIGWLEAPPALAPTVENLIQFSTSGVPVAAQRAAIAALDQGEAFLAEHAWRACAPRATSGRRPGGDRAASVSRLPEGAFYLFCAVDGEPDSRRLALRLIDEAGIGVAPGSAFGPGGEGYLRICFAGAAEVISPRRRAASRAGCGR